MARTERADDVGRVGNDLLRLLLGQRVTGDLNRESETPTGLSGSDLAEARHRTVGLIESMNLAGECE